MDKAKHFDKMIELPVAKVKMLKSNKIKIQILTLAPIDWSHKKVIEVFSVSEHMICKAYKLCLERGILTVPEPKKKKSKSLPADLVQLSSKVDLTTSKNSLVNLSRHSRC